MSIIISILAIYTLAFVARNISGPFNIFGLLRNKLVQSQHLGVFFYELLDCPWCSGFHAGYLIYLLQFDSFDIRHLFLWGLAGSAITAFMDAILNKLNNQN